MTVANTFAIERALSAGGPRSNWLPEILPYAVASGQTFYKGALVIVSSGQAAEASSNTTYTATIIGIAEQSAIGVYNPTNTATTNFEQAFYTTLFGESQYGTKLNPDDEDKVHIAHGVQGQYFELTAAGAASASTDVGSTFDAKKDSTTAYWTIDLSTTSHGVFIVDWLVAKPKMLSGTSPAQAQGGAIPAFGDTNVRYICHFKAATVL